MVTVPVQFNEPQFKDKLVPACKSFFKKIIIPKMLIDNPNPDVTSPLSSDEKTTTMKTPPISGTSEI